MFGLFCVLLLFFKFSFFSVATSRPALDDGWAVNGGGQHAAGRAPCCVLVARARDLRSSPPPPRSGLGLVPWAAQPSGPAAERLGPWAAQPSGSTAKHPV